MYNEKKMILFLQSLPVFELQSLWDRYFVLIIVLLLCYGESTPRQKIIKLSPLSEKHL